MSSEIMYSDASKWFMSFPSGLTNLSYTVLQLLFSLVPQLSSGASNHLVSLEIQK